MNRSFFNVLFGGFGSAGKKIKVEGKCQSISKEDLAQELINANDIVIVPGYGLAVARAQHTIGEIAKLLIKHGKRVRFIIHPVAGRLPGHMNVLLAEANIPYDIVLAMEEVNDIDKTDVAIVVGANDIVNPIAQTHEDSNIAGMPIIEVYKSKLCVINKRSMGVGYAGVDNPLFVNENSRMYFGDAKQAFDQILVELQKFYSSKNPVKKRKEIY